MRRGLLLALVMVAIAACGGGTDRSMEPPRTAPGAPTDTSAAGTGDQPALEGDAADPTAEGTGAGAGDLNAGGDGDGGGTDVVDTGGDEGAGDAPAATEDGDDGDSRDGGRGTALSPTPSPPPDGVDTTVFPVEFGMNLPWDDGGEIPPVYTCDGPQGGRNPLVAWFPPPGRTVELALVVVDEDADGFVHWVATGIDPGSGALSPGEQRREATEFENGHGDTGWGPPCPAEGDDEHTYRFTLYAADEPITVDGDMTPEDVIAAIDETAFRSVSAAGVYGR